MARGLQERTVYAILETITANGAERYQTYWGEWESIVKGKVADVDKAHLTTAFRWLWRHGYITLLKPDGSAYSGKPADDQAFFFMEGEFGATITDEGREHWDQIQKGQNSGIGFTAGF